MAKLIIERSSEYENKIRKINIFLNDEPLVKIKDGETKEFDIQPGEHHVIAKIDWCTSNLISFKIDDNSKVKLFLQSGSGPSLYRISFGRKKYMKLSLQDL